MRDRYDEERQERARQHAELNAKREAEVRERAELLRSMCTRCMATGQAMIGPLCVACDKMLRDAGGDVGVKDIWIDPVDDSFYDASDVQAEPDGRCISCGLPNPVRDGLCVSCWLLQHPDIEFPQPDADAPQREWDAYLAQLPLERHHLASDKAFASGREAIAREIAEKFGLELGDTWNLPDEGIRHRGRHPNEYHAYVLGTMQYIAEVASDADEFKRLYREMVEDTVRGSPQMLRRRAWYPRRRTKRAKRAR